MSVQYYQAKIAKITQETPFARTFLLDLRGEMQFLPGQFVMVELKKMPGVKRAYSLSSSPTQTKTVSITLKKEGQFTTEMFSTAEGEEITIRGPMGHFVLHEQSKEEIVFIAGGTGVAPFRSMISFVLEKGMPNKMTLYYSCKNPEEFIFYREFVALQAKYPQFTPIFTATRCQDPSWNGFCERINPNMLTRTLQEPKACMYYICGPTEMVASMQAMLDGMGIEKKKTKVERWG